MTARTDIQRMARALAGGDVGDETLLLRYYGADGPWPRQAASQTELATDLSISRQAVHAKIGRLLARITSDQLERLTLESAVRLALANGDDVGRRALGGVRREDATRFYQDITGVKPPRAEDAPLQRVPAAQFDALVMSVYGPRKQNLIAAARLVLVRGRGVDQVAKDSGISAMNLRRAADEIAQLHTEALVAYGQKPD
jgi:hypothetical protein